jgi:hypothetical protein
MAQQHLVDAAKRGLDRELRAVIRASSGSEESAAKGIRVDPGIDDVHTWDVRPRGSIDIDMVPPGRQTGGQIRDECLRAPTLGLVDRGDLRRHQGNPQAGFLL